MCMSVASIMVTFGAGYRIPLMIYSTDYSHLYLLCITSKSRSSARFPSTSLEPVARRRSVVFTSQYGKKAIYSWRHQCGRVILSGTAAETQKIDFRTFQSLPGRMQKNEYDRSQTVVTVDKAAVQILSLSANWHAGVKLTACSIAIKLCETYKAYTRRICDCKTIHNYGLSFCDQRLTAVYFYRYQFPRLTSDVKQIINKKVLNIMEHRIIGNNRHVP